jgi:hypothetical protein
MNNKKGYVKRLPFSIGQLVKSRATGHKFIALEPNTPWTSDSQELFWHTQKVHCLVDNRQYWMTIEELAPMGESGEKWEVVGIGGEEGSLLEDKALSVIE